jgi:Predicted phosphatase/phosphohexomutase
MIEAILFDVDGTLAETEELHRRAFNETFAALGVDWFWDREEYRELLTTRAARSASRGSCAIRRAIRRRCPSPISTAPRPSGSWR